MIEEALREAGLEREQIEVLAVGLGPGSYTGIRVALSLAQGWQLASGDGGMKVARHQQRGMCGGAGAGGKNFRPRERGD